MNKQIRMATKKAARTAFGNGSHAIFHKGTNAPSSESWWRGLSREQFQRAAPGEVERMSKSKFGRMALHGTEVSA